MIPVRPAEEPPNFDADVRRPGLQAVSRLGQTFGGRGQIPAGEFPAYWRRILPELLTRYERICSYLCLYIPHGTGAPSVDHMVAKSMRWDQVYEWTNYRLACSLMNARKGAVETVLDPFEIQDNWFALELVEFQVVPGEALPSDIATAVEDTIERLRLNDLECCKARSKFVEEYQQRHVSLDYLRRHAPFVERELRRQGRVLEADR